MLAALLVATAVLIPGLFLGPLMGESSTTGRSLATAAPTRTHGDAWLGVEALQGREALPPWDGRPPRRGLVAAGCIGGGIAMVPAVHCPHKGGQWRRKVDARLAPGSSRRSTATPTDPNVRHRPRPGSPEIRA